MDRVWPGLHIFGTSNNKKKKTRTLEQLVTLELVCVQKTEAK